MCARTLRIMLGEAVVIAADEMLLPGNPERPDLRSGGRGEV